ncbi:MAG: electron transfer flavoprotein subunit alpha/FixB family protein [Thaumarchaeota archaeon]|jgi:electron transfer flavoprotein alpha subunit|nr:electron transfer flavoprotein subunit alpha/FixB family protein [Nitrososphaerota archaeon]
MKSLIFSESAEIIKEMLNFLNGKMEADVAFAGETSEAPLFAAKKVFIIDSYPYDPQTVALALEGIVGGYDYFFVGATTVGREVAAMVSQDMNMPMESEIMSFGLENGQAKVSRFYYGGKTVMEKITSARVFTVMAGISDQLVPDKPYEQEVIMVHVQSGGINLISREEKQKGSVDLTKADIIVAVGRGIGKKEGLEVAEQLASALGAELAGSRPVCSDLHWLGEERQVGLSGKRVKPKVYIALGISGQIQHIVGMRDSKTVIAINRDKSAPIFNECDYGLVGDLYAIVPKLVQAIRS